ncbi:hypothetical protein AM629_00770 [Photorhabdus heterorhabditis]|uniref:Uncharacterized protein n=1 Tax=Photorhabdus heterorhabditis TaxID=880156 RepID=A0ABR5KHF5_9GAMM|nr:hypothetical protein AM629_00770 [Photorhabdus heterorhabditis]
MQPLATAAPCYADYESVLLFLRYFDLLGDFIKTILYPSSFKLLLCWLRSLTLVTSLSMLLGMYSLAAALQFEIYWVYLLFVGYLRIYL